MFAFLDPALIHVHDLLTHLDPLVPPALVVVLLTLATRMLLHPMNRRNQRSMIARRALQPRLDALRDKHGEDQQAYTQAMLELHRSEKVPVAPGCLSIFIQLPVFSMVYRLFTAPTIAGRPNELLDHTFFGTPMSAHLLTADAGQRWVFFAIMGVALLVAGVAAWQLRRHLAADRERTRAGNTGRTLTPQQEAMQRSMEQVTGMMPFMSFLTVSAVAMVPLAAGIYLATSSTWGVLERASLRRMVTRAEAPGTTGVEGAQERSQPA